MLRLALALALTLGGQAFAQPAPPVFVPPDVIEQKVRQQLGDLMFSVTVLTAQVEHLQQELQKARAKAPQPDPPK